MLGASRWRTWDPLVEGDGFQSQPWVLWLCSGSERSCRGVGILGGRKRRQIHLSNGPKGSHLPSPPPVTPLGALLVLMGHTVSEECVGQGEAHCHPPLHLLLTGAISQALSAHTSRPLSPKRGSRTPIHV